MLNKAQIIGRLGQDPEVRYTAGGSAVANLSVATTEKWKDKESGKQQEKTEWHKIIAFGRLAEIISEYLRKGSLVYFEGKIQTRKWQDKDDNDRYTTEIVASDMKMLSSKGEGKQPAPPEQNSSDFQDDEIPF